LTELTEVERPLRLANLARLRELVRLHHDEVSVFSSHDPWEFAAIRDGRPSVWAADVV
jgi:hypothetical protein